MKASRIIVLGLLFITGYMGANSFDNILLIIGYNFAHYESMPLLEKIYKPYFKNIAFYGPREDSQVQSFSYHKYLIYESIADAMKNNPDFEGYFFVMDDCVFHPWLLEKLDQAKIWMPKIGFLTSEHGNPINVELGINASPWETWQGEWGWKPMLESYKELPRHYKRVLTSNWGPSNVVAGYADIVFIPSLYREQFIELADVFFSHSAHLELALPTIVSCLSPKSSWIWLPGWGPDRTRPIEDYKYNVVFNHPVKLSVPQYRDFIEQYFEIMMYATKQFNVLKSEIMTYATKRLNALKKGIINDAQ